MKLKMVLNLFFFCWVSNAFAVVTTQTAFDEQDQQYLTYTENFAPDASGAPSNIGAWRFGGIANAPYGETEGPTKGIYYRAVGKKIAQVHAPAFMTNAQSIFTGNYIQENVVELSFTTQVTPEFSPLVRPMSIILGNTDQGIYLYKSVTDCRDANDHCPGTTAIASTWATYQFKVPQSVAQAQAENWQVYSDRNSCTKIASCFNEVMSNVQRVGFVYGNPSVPYTSNPPLTINATEVSIKKRITAKQF